MAGKQIAGGSRMGRRTFLLVGILLCIVIYLMLTTICIYTYSKKEETCHAEVAIILGAGVTEDSVSPVYRERINHGIWLYKNDYVNAIIVTGGVGDGQTESDAAVARRYAIQQGVPENAIYAEEQSTITQENIANSAEIMRDRSLHKALIVSDPLHMRRAMLMASDYGIEAYSSPTPTSMYRSMKTKIPFLCREEFFYVGYRLYRLFHKGA